MVTMEDPLMSSDGSCNRGDPSERCPRPLHSQDSTAEDLHHPRQSEDQTDAEEDVKGGDPCEEEIPAGVSPTDGSVRRNAVERRPLPIFSLKRDGRKWQRLRIKSEINLEVREEDAVEEQKERPRNLPERYPSPGLSDTSDTDNSQQDLQAESPGGGANGGTLQEEDLYATDEQEMEEESGLDFDAGYEVNYDQGFDHYHPLAGDLRLQKLSEEYDQDIEEENSSDEEEKNFICSDCGKSFSHFSFLSKHQRAHLEEKPFPCDICGKRFKYKRGLAAHHMMHIDENIRRGTLESAESPGGGANDGILQEEDLYMTDEQEMKEEECGLDVDTGYEVSYDQGLDHYHPLAGDIRYKKLSEEYDQVIVGENQPARGGIPPAGGNIPPAGGGIPPAGAGNPPVRGRNRPARRRNRPDRVRKQFICSECGSIFSHFIHLSKHLRSHVGVKPFSCTECDKRFSHKTSLVAHQRLHTGENPFTCSECGKVFTNKCNLKAHERIHSGDKPVVCPACGKCFANNPALVKHRRIHTGEKPFSCDQCGKLFSSRSGLTAHLILHTGEKPFTCSECGKSFANQSNLISHRIIHTGEKPYTCDKCGKGFANQSNLAKHRVIHTEEKPFICTECGKAFTRKGSLEKHGQRIHEKNKRVLKSPEPVNF